MEGENDNMNALRATSRLYQDSHTRIQRKQEREIEALKQLKLQTQVFKASKESETYLRRIPSKALTAPVTPLTTSSLPYAMNCNPNFDIDQEVADSKLAFEIASLQTRLRSMETHPPTTETGTQTISPPQRRIPRIETPPPIPRPVIKWSQIFDSIISNDNQLLYL